MLAEASREKPSGHEILDRLSGRPFVGRPKTSEMNEFQIRNRLKTPPQLNLILRRQQTAKERRGEVGENGILALQRHHGPRVAKLRGRAQCALP